MRVALLSILLPLVASAPLKEDCFTGRRLTFDDNDNFQISLFGDLHFGEDAWTDWAPRADRNSVAMLRSVLGEETPQLVVLNGDLITGENAFFENGSVYVDQIVQPILDRSLPWASTYGNHDYQYNVTAATIMEREQKHPNCLTTSMVPGRDAGVSNYYLPVYPRGCSEACAPKLLLWFFDSRGGFFFQEKHPNGKFVGQENWVHQSVVDWFQKTNADLTEQFGRTIPSMGFVHIPPYIFRAIQDEDGGKNMNPITNPGANFDLGLNMQSSGWCPDGADNGTCKYGGQDGPFMKAIASTAGMIALFSAHDHGESWCYKWNRKVDGTDMTGNGVNLCFGQQSGYGGYDNSPIFPRTRGGRQIRVNGAQLNDTCDLIAETWIRLDDGRIVASVVLNSTFNQDEYPAYPPINPFAIQSHDVDK